MLTHYSVRVGPADRGREGREDCTLQIKITIIQKKCLDLKGCERFYFRICFWYAADIISHYKLEFPASSLLFVLVIESLVRNATASRDVKITGSQAGTRPICYKTITSIHLRLKWRQEDVSISRLYPSYVSFVDCFKYVLWFTAWSKSGSYGAKRILGNMRDKIIQLFQVLNMCFTFGGSVSVDKQDNMKQWISSMKLKSKDVDAVKLCQNCRDATELNIMAVKVWISDLATRLTIIRLFIKLLKKYTRTQKYIISSLRGRRHIY